MGKDQNVQIPNSNNLEMIVKEMSKLKNFTTDLAPLIVDWSKTIKTFGKIDTKELNTNAKAVKNISDGIDIFIDSVGYVMKCLKKLNDEFSLEDITNLRDKLMTTESGGDVIITKNIESKGVSSLDLTKEITKAKISNPGLIDIVAQVATLSNILANIQFINPIKFKLKFAQTIRLFKWQYEKLVKFTNTFDIKTIRTIKFATDGIQEVMMTLPSATASMAEMFAKYGKPKQRILISSGITALLGENKDGTGGLVWAMLMLSEQLNEKTLDPDTVAIFEKSVKSLSKVLKSISETLAIVAITSPLLKLGVFTLFGRGKGKDGHGVMGAILTGFGWMAEKSKQIQQANKSLLIIAGALALISLTALTLAITGIFIAKSWQYMLLTIAFTGLIIGLFALVSLASRIVKEGEKELLYIAATVGILALTALLMAYVGQFITDNWQSMLITMAFMGVLVLAFMAVSLATKWIKQGGKDLLYIAATVGILALVAVLLVFVGQYLEANWNSLLAIGLMMAGMIGMVLAIGYAGKMIENAEKSMVKLLICIGLLTIMMITLAIISQIADPLEILALVGIMTLIIGALGSLAFVASKFKKSLGIGIGVLLMISEISLIMTGVMLGLATAAAIADPLEILAIAGIMTAIVAAIGGMAIAAGTFLFGPQAILFGLGEAAVLTMAAIGIALAAVINSLVVAKQAADNAGMTDAYEIGKIVVLPLDVFTMKKFGDNGDKSIIDIIEDLPNITKSRWKVRQLEGIISSISNIAITLQKMASMNMPVAWDSNGKPIQFEQMKDKDFADAATNAGSILRICAGIFADESETVEIMGKKIIVNSQAPVLKDLDNIGRKTKNKVARLGKIIGSIGDIAITLQNIASLNIPTEWNEDGKPVKFRSMDTTDFLNASLNAGGILKFFAALFDDTQTSLKVLGGSISITPLSTDVIDNISNKTKRKMNKLKVIVGYVGEMADTMQKVASLTVPNEIDQTTGQVKTWKIIESGDFDTASKNIAKIMTTLVGAISEDALAEQLDNLSKKSIKNFERVMGSLGGLTSITEILQLLAGGEIATKFITDTDKNSATYGQRIPDPSGYKKLTDIINDENITKNIESLFSVVINAFAAFNNGSGKKLLKDAGKVTDDIQEVINGSTECLSSLVTTYNEYFANVDMESLSAKYSTASNVMVEIIRMFGGTKVNIKGANVLKTNIDKTTALIKQVNTVDVEKLKTTSELMRHISELSRSIHGNFEGLAKVISEDLMEALQKLTDALDGVKNTEINTTVETKQVSTPGDILKYQSGSAGVKDKQKEQPQKITKADIDAITKAINELKNVIPKIPRKGYGDNAPILVAD